VLGLAAGFCLGLVYAGLSKSKRIARPVKRPSERPVEQPAAPSISIDDLLAGGPPTAADELRQNLRLKFMYDEEKVDRAIATERERDPGAGEEELMRSAIQRWERDNS